MCPPKFSTPRLIPKKGEFWYSLISRGSKLALSKKSFKFYYVLLTHINRYYLKDLRVFKGSPSGFFCPTSGSTVVKTHLAQYDAFLKIMPLILMKSQSSSSNGPSVPGSRG